METTTSFGQPGYGQYAAHHYEIGRPDFSFRIVSETLMKTGLVVPIRVADIGSGTGKIARLFKGIAARLDAIEPSPAMRGVADSLLQKESWYYSRDAQAEKTGLEDACIDLITCGRSIHWFDHEKAIPEFRRILKPAGWLVIASARLLMPKNMNEELVASIFAEGASDISSTPQKSTSSCDYAWYFGKSVEPVRWREEAIYDYPGFISFLLGRSSNHADQEALTSRQANLADQVFTRIAPDGFLRVDQDVRVWIGQMN